MAAGPGEHFPRAGIAPVATAQRSGAIGAAAGAGFCCAGVDGCDGRWPLVGAPVP